MASQEESNVITVVAAMVATLQGMPTGPQKTAWRKQVEALIDALAASGYTLRSGIELPTAG